MMAAYRCLLSALLAAVLFATVVQQVNADWKALEAVSRSNSEFSNSLYQILSRQEGNLIFSPASIHTILALTSLGARGSTAEEMIRGLHLTANQQQTKDGFRDLTNSWRAMPGVNLNVANKIFTSALYPVKSEFARTAREDFNSSTSEVDFAKDQEGARALINSWVKKETRGKIVDILPPGSVNEKTVVILVNAVFFKGTWKTKFSASDTYAQPFHVSADRTVNVLMMHLGVETKFGYKKSKVLKAQVLEIPYDGNKMSLVFILPFKRDGLKDVEARLAKLSLSNFTSSIPEIDGQLYVSLPRFKLEQSIDNMKNALSQMGMRQMFQSSSADFSGLTNGPMYVSKVVHKAFIEVNEKGTEAAAATAAVVSEYDSASDEELITFEANHPFIFFLVSTEAKPKSHSKVRNILFMGRYAKP